MKCRCGENHHNQPEFNEEAAISRLSKVIADEIDRQILEELSELYNDENEPTGDRKK